MLDDSANCLKIGCMLWSSHSKVDKFLPLPSPVTHSASQQSAPIQPGELPPPATTEPSLRRSPSLSLQINPLIASTPPDLNFLSQPLSPPYSHSNQLTTTTTTTTTAQAYFPSHHNKFKARLHGQPRLTSPSPRS
ncbi:hypothetical protein PGTUg99_017368 [Puccinia graminis f. sp. tritici]|uniref:Uncharacterized protein n=1 Tax=Puccinia graminis f. sp. tritici TaxID=56615 RepID=A0A5B0SEN3_PUCGR|nr:hypothetical protein PGTUg99_017368 [Puccinia graminis f. sp. tritici]